MVTVLMVTKLVVTVLVVTALVATVLVVTVPVITVPVVNILVVTGHCACCLCLFKKCFPNCYDFSRSYSTFFLVFLLDLSPSCTVIQFFLWCLSFLVLVFISFSSVIRTFFSILYYRYRCFLYLIFLFLLVLVLLFIFIFPLQRRLHVE